MQRKPRSRNLNDSAFRPYRWLVTAAIVMLAATGCSEQVASTPVGGTEQLFSAQELAQARRIRPDPRNYGVRMDAGQRAAYRDISGDSD